MKYRVTQQHELSNAHSPFRVVEQTGREVDWVNRYLDQERVRGMADSTLRSYAHDLLHFLRWWAGANQTSTITQQALIESTFLDYIRFQLNQNPPPAAASINRRVGTTERAMRCEFPEAAPLFAPGFQNWYWRRSRLGWSSPTANGCGSPRTRSPRTRGSRRPSPIPGRRAAGSSSPRR